MSQNKMSLSVKRLTESAVMIAVSTVLSVLSFQGPWALGGSITVACMLPIVIIAFRYGTPWGLFTGFVASLIQLLLGLKNVQYATSFIMAVGIIMLDYVLAFSVIGLAGVFYNKTKKPVLDIVLGITVTFLLRYLCHFVSGYIIWEALWPNELGWLPAVWSLAYNGSYMIPEIIITSLVAIVSYSPLKNYWTRQV